jgi:DDE superfamily endonuclease
VLACLLLSRMFGGRIVLAVDATPWPRPDAETCPQRLFCHVYGRTRESDQLLPGWPYQLVAACESGPTSWTALLDVVRLGPADDATAVTADQLRAVADRPHAAGHWTAADPPMLVVCDASYDVSRMSAMLLPGKAGQTATTIATRDDSGRPPEGERPDQRGGAEGTRTPDPHTARAAGRGPRMSAVVHFGRSSENGVVRGWLRTTVHAVVWPPSWHHAEAA